MRRLAYIANVTVSIILAITALLTFSTFIILVQKYFSFPYNFALTCLGWFLIYLAILAVKEKCWKAFVAWSNLKQAGKLIGILILLQIAMMIVNRWIPSLDLDTSSLFAIFIIFLKPSFSFPFFRWGRIDDIPAFIKSSDNRKLEQVTALYPEQVNARTSSGHTPLTLALANDAPVEMIKYLLEAGADPNITDSRDIPPLFIAIFHSVVNKNDEPVELLLKYGAKTNVVIRGSDFLLHLTADMKNAKVIRTLLDYQADPNSVDDQGFTPLHIAAITGNVAAAKLLLKHGADVNARTAAGVTPLQLAELPGPYYGLLAIKGRRRVAEILRQQASMG